MKTDIERGLEELECAEPAYNLAASYYEGTIPEVFADRRIERRLQRIGHRFRINFAKLPVSVVADRLKVAAVTAVDNPEATAILSQVWDANDMDLHAPNFTLRASEFGDCYALVWPVASVQELSVDGDDEDLDEGSAEQDEQLTDADVEISYVSPMNMRVVYDTERPNRKEFAIMRWRNEDDDTTRVNVFYADRVERWVSGPGARGAASDSWTKFGEDVENPYGEIPVFHFRNASQYGVPEHYDAYGPQDLINKLVVTQMATIESHGFPQRYALADAASILDIASGDGDDWDGDEDQSGEQGGSKPGVQTGPGVLMSLQGFKSVGQFDEAKPDVFIDPYQLYVRSMAQVTTTPLHYFDPSGGQPSGESLRTANAPLDNKLERRRAWYGSTFAEIGRFVLLIRGVQDAVVEVHWMPDAVVSDKAAWEVVALKQSLGVPRRQTLTEVGYSSEQATEYAETSTAELDLLHKVELLDKIGEAMQKIGAGVGFGLITSEVAGQIVSRVIGELTLEGEQTE